MSHAFNRHPLRIWPFFAFAWLCACGDSDKKSANLDSDGRDAGRTETSSPRDGSAAETTEDAALGLDASPADAALGVRDAGYVPGALLGDANIDATVGPALPTAAPLCSEGETWSGSERVDAFPEAATALLAVAAESGTRVFLREPLPIVQPPPVATSEDAGQPTTADAGDAGLDGSVAPLDASVAPLDAGDSGPDPSRLPTAWLLVEDGDSVVTVGLPSTFDVEAGVGIDPTGLRLVLVMSGRTGLALSSRSSLGAEFGEPTIDAFSRINALGMQGGARFASPVWSASGERLYVAEGEGVSEPLQLNQQGGYWAVEARLAWNGLQDVVVTSSAADDLTVFTFNEEEGHAAAHWRDHPALPFREVQSLDIEWPVHVDETCARLRFQAPCAEPDDCRQFVERTSE